MLPRRSPEPEEPAHAAGRLLARPAAPPAGPVLPGGVHELDQGPGGPALLVVPEGLAAGVPVPLAVALHGAGGDARSGLGPLRAEVERPLALLSVSSRSSTWDIIRGGFGPDVAALDRALTQTFARLHVDPARLAVTGFSDGASYALSLGLTNGELFTHVIAFSPGFMVPGEPQGRPPVLVTHGVEDRVLPIDRCSRRLVPALRRAGYDIDYREFPGGHVVPPELAAGAVSWLRGEE